MTNKATHTGTCQICGSRQMLPDGKLAKHGYTVPAGFFQGVCIGSGRRPLELERGFADDVAADLRVQAAALTKHADDLLDGRVTPRQASAGFQCQTRPENRDRYGRGKWQTVMMPFADAEHAEQQRAIADAVQETQSRASEATHIAEAIVRRADLITGKQELQPRVDDQRVELAAGMRVKVWGEVRTIKRIESRATRGTWKRPSGDYIPHAVFESNGREYFQPVRLIRQSAIVR